MSCQASKHVYNILFILFFLTSFLLPFAFIGIGAYVQYQMSNFIVFLNTPYLNMLPIMLILIGVFMIAMFIAACLDWICNTKGRKGVCDLLSAAVDRHAHTEKRAYINI